MRKQALIALLLLLALLPCPGCASDAGRRKLTLMIYLCGSNLESSYGSASADILEILDNRPADDQVSVLIMTGGATQWSLGFDAEKTMIHEVGSRGLRTVWPAAGAEAAAMNMGDPDTLTFLLTYGKEHYPARDYALILWDHGGGPMAGVCWDELFSMQHLSLNGLAQAIHNARFSSPLSWIGFDACLMGSFEVACTMAPYARYMIASQETEPASGWHYTFLRDIGRDEDGAATGRRIVDAYFEGAENSKEALTLSCIDLSRVSMLREAMNRSFSSLAGQLDETSFPRLSGLRRLSTGFGKATAGSDDADYDLVDLSDLIARLGLAEDDALTRALGDMVVSSRANIEGAGGLSVYHPLRNKNKYVEAWHDSYRQTKSSQGYADYIFRFASLLTASERTDWSGLKTVREDGGHYFCALTDAQAASFQSARLLVLLPNVHNDGVSDSYTLIGDIPAAMDEQGVVRAEYHGRTLYAITPGEDVDYVTGPLTYYLSGRRDQGVLPALYQPRETAHLEGMQSGVILFDIPTWDEETEAPIRLVRMHDPATDTFTSRIEYRPADYSELWFDSIQQAMPENSESGTLPAYREWPYYSGRISWQGLSLDEDWHLYFFDHQLSGEHLTALFEITDAQQNAFCASPAPVDHPGITPFSVTSGPVETEQVRAELAAEAVDTDLDQSLNLFLRLTNRTNEKIACRLRNVRLNGSRALQGGKYVKLDPGESRVVTISLSGAQLEGLTVLTGVEGSLIVELEASGEETETPFHFALSDADLRPIAPPLPVLAETEAGGITWRLLGLQSADDGDLALRLQVVNSTSEPYEIPYHAVIAINHVQTEITGLRGATVSPGTETTLTATFRDALLLDTFDHVQVQNLVNFLRPLALSQRILARHGQRQVEDVSIGLYEYDLSGNTVTLHLDQPVDIPVFQPESQNHRWYGALPDVPPEAIRPLPLMDWPQAAVAVERVLVGDNGIAAVLDIENRTREPLSLSCRLTELNGRSVDSAYISTDFRVLPGCTLTAKMPIEFKEALSVETAVSSFSFRLTGLPVIEDPVLSVRFGEPARLGVTGGVTLESGDMNALMPDAPKPAVSSIPTDIRYQAVRIMYEDWEWGEEWLDHTDSEFFITLRPEGRVEMSRYGSPDTGFRWIADTDGSVVLRNSYRAYRMYTENGQVYLSDPGFARYLLTAAP